MNALNLKLKTSSALISMPSNGEEHCIQIESVPPHRLMAPTDEK